MNAEPASLMSYLPVVTVCIAGANFLAMVIVVPLLTRLNKFRDDQISELRQEVRDLRKILESHIYFHMKGQADG